MGIEALARTLLLINLVHSLNVIEEHLNKIERRIKRLRKSKSENKLLALCRDDVQEIMCTIYDSLEILDYKDVY